MILSKLISYLFIHVFGFCNIDNYETDKDGIVPSISSEGGEYGERKEIKNREDN